MIIFYSGSSAGNGNELPEDRGLDVMLTYAEILTGQWDAPGRLRRIGKRRRRRSATNLVNAPQR